MLEIRISRHSEKFMMSVSPKHARQIKTKFNALRLEPFPHDTKQLIGFPFYRTDVGEYRIVYKVEQTILFIVLVGKRNDDEIYKKLKRL